jgi:hypothetical protein
MAENKYFVDVFGDVVAAVRAEYDTTNNEEPYYMYGHPREIAQRLDLKNRDDVEKFKKWPLVVLITDFSEDHDSDQDYSYEVSPTVLIVTNTNENYRSEETYENTFKPILYPIYEELLNQLRLSNYFKKPGQLIEHEKIDRLFWGTSGAQGNEGLIFNTFLDAIELNFSSLKVFEDYTCQ